MLAPFDARGDVLAFRLRKGAVDRDEEFALRVDGVDILLLKDDWDAHTPQFTGIGQGIYCISGEAGDRFGEDHIDLSLSALSDHAEEVLAFAG